MYLAIPFSILLKFLLMSSIVYYTIIQLYNNINMFYFQFYLANTTNPTNTANYKQ